MNVALTLKICIKKPKKRRLAKYCVPKCRTDLFCVKSLHRITNKKPKFTLCSVVLLKELWHGNIISGEDSRNNSKEMKELLGYMARHHEDLAKTITDEQKEIFEKFHDCWDEYVSLAEAAIFEYAFKLGMQIAIETLIE